MKNKKLIKIALVRFCLIIFIISATSYSIGKFSVISMVILAILSFFFINFIEMVNDDEKNK